MTRNENDSEPNNEIVEAIKPTGGMAAMDASQSAPGDLKRKGMTTGQRIQRVVIFLLRLILVLILLAGISVGVAYLLPMLYQKYIQPVNVNTTRLEQLGNQLSTHEASLEGLQTSVSSMQTEQVQQNQAVSSMDDRLQELNDQVTLHTRSLESLEKIANQAREDNLELSRELTDQINLLKSMELLSRARLFLYQSNFGLARQDVQAAQNLLKMIQADSPGNLGFDLQEVIHRLDLALANLPTFPVAASDDLDIAWQILISGAQADQVIPTTLTPAGVEATPTPTLVSTPSPISTP
jgi:hypothetical protein